MFGIPGRNENEKQFLASLVKLFKSMMQTKRKTVFICKQYCWMETVGYFPDRSQVLVLLLKAEELKS